MDTTLPLVAIVDDDATVTMMLERVLARSGYRTRVFGSGEAILEAAGDGIDLICLDLSLPGIDGLETLRQLKARQVRVPVVLFTASAEDVRAEALAAGAAACVPKSGAWAELRAALATARASAQDGA